MINKHCLFQFNFTVRNIAPITWTQWQLGLNFNIFQLGLLMIPSIKSSEKVEMKISGQV